MSLCSYVKAALQYLKLSVIIFQAQVPNTLSLLQANHTHIFSNIFPWIHLSRPFIIVTTVLLSSINVFFVSFEKEIQELDRQGRDCFPLHIQSIFWGYQSSKELKELSWRKLIWSVWIDKNQWLLVKWEAHRKYTVKWIKW